MSDVQTTCVDMQSGIDWTLDGADLASDAGLRTAVIISLFTDARAKDDDALPIGQTDRRGWWGDAYPAAERDRTGSRLWLLSAEKQLLEALNPAREYAEESLAWLIDDGIAAKVEVETFIARFEVMGMSIRIIRPDASVVPVRFDLLWSAMR